MASTSHPGQLRNSTSPSVLALNSSKAPSAAAAKPRFRSRTGCWTCRRRKVKCDERGRNPETVAYGGPLPTSSGCKRCEDSGRPCHGYGAQAPPSHVISQYSSGNLPTDPSISSAPFYSFSSHVHETSHSTSYSPALGNVEAVSCPVPQSMQWSQHLEQSLPGSQSINCGLRIAHNAPASSGPSSTSIRDPSLAPPHASSIHQPSAELRRYSVPCYPTWQRSSQPRNTDQYSSAGLVGNGLFQSSNGQYENLEAEVHPLTSSSSLSERTQALSHPSDCTVLPTDIYQTFSSNDLPSHYIHDLNETEPKPFSFNFGRGRPHTSSGVSSSFDDHQSLQSNPNTYHSPINPNTQAHESIGDSERQYPDPLPISSTAVCSDVAPNLWSEKQSGPASLIAFRPMPPTNNNQCVISAAQNPLFPSQINDPLNYHTRDGFPNVSATDIPIFHDIPYDIFAGHPSTLHSKLGGTEGRDSNSTEESSEQSLYISQMDPLAEMLTRDAHENLRPTCSYIRSCALPAPTESEKDPIPPRKGSSSSSSSSLSTQEHTVSPVATAIRHSFVFADYICFKTGFPEYQTSGHPAAFSHHFKLIITISSPSCTIIPPKANLLVPMRTTVPLPPPRLTFPVQLEPIKISLEDIREKSDVEGS
ncbi:hypothetical protein VP01_436g5 [Puccinia sorghi]|uniref:Zn(2)-C6 fungal-type domain-containing protein n=1 Tax=Puccinia sorghi TaxID=27349 RepID=A0A0L6URR7_9BASI|nr:hypothetical protein VP01_436g5 [Puccinia sorghi]